MRRAVTLLTVLAVLFVAGVAIGSGPLTGSIEAWRVLVADETGEESFVPAGEASPRDLIEYRLTYANSGESAVRTVSIVDPIPSGTEYVVRTATQPGGAAVTFSVDNGKTFHAWPVRIRVMVDGREVWKDAPAGMVTHVRWTLNDELEPAEQVTMAYRAVVR
ncbi:MAG: hypothetical protein OEY32_14620 [Candidatus Krumholzibacteria bacterium]|nr:hypothetical protein [Candidatus Krumholzibacteria bacterium]MDH5271149.1 hypothetical protein [Candidatus Krumholzibacteria bacterium]